MRKIVPVLFAVAGLSMASSVFVYDFDLEDLIYDPVVGDSIDTSYWIEQTLLSLGDTVDTGTELPADISAFDAVFVMMGMFTGSGDTNVIPPNERIKINAYLDGGGSVYFEGCDIGYSNHNYDIWSYTGLIYAGDGAPSTTGNVQGITGFLMCSGMEFGYPYKTMADNYVDYFTTTGGGTLIFESQEGLARAGCYTGPSNNYRTITSAVIFSALQEDATTREELMAVYMEFLTGGTGTAGENSTSLTTFSVSAVNPTRGSFSATVTLNGSAFCDLGLFDVTGRRVGTLVSGTLSQGTHELSVSAGELASGTYLVSGTVGDEQVRSQTVLLR